VHRKSREARERGPVVSLPRRQTLFEFELSAVEVLERARNRRGLAIDEHYVRRQAERLAPERQQKVETRILEHPRLVRVNRQEQLPSATA
jgi:hypothetical protein